MILKLPEPKAIIYKVEKTVTVNALKDLIKYTLTKKSTDMFIGNR